MAVVRNGSCKNGSCKKWQLYEMAVVKNGNHKKMAVIKNDNH
jgi:hypothetical protein